MTVARWPRIMAILVASGCVVRPATAQSISLSLKRAFATNVVAGMFTDTGYCRDSAARGRGSTTRVCLRAGVGVAR